MLRSANMWLMKNIIDSLHVDCKSIDTIFVHVCQKIRF